MRTVLFSTTAALVLIIGVLTIRWMEDHVVPTPVPVNLPKTARIQHQAYLGLALRAVRRYREMTAPERSALGQQLEQALLGLEQWRRSEREAPPGVICLGERHADDTRRFVAQELVSELPIDRLLLEASPTDWDALDERISNGEPYVDLLNADIAHITHAARAANRSVRIVGIDESEAQRSDRLTNNRLIRDISIFENLEAALQAGAHHVVLFGALHCADRWPWLYARLRKARKRLQLDRIVSANVLSEHDNGALEAFIYFLERTGLYFPNFVIPDTAALPDTVFELFPPLATHILPYRTVIVFAPELPTAHAVTY